MTCSWHGSMMYTCLLQQLKESWEYDTAEERKTDAEKLKEKGNRYFKVTDWVYVGEILALQLCHNIFPHNFPLY